MDIPSGAAKNDFFDFFSGLADQDWPQFADMDPSVCNDAPLEPHDAQQLPSTLFNTTDILPWSKNLLCLSKDSLSAVGTQLPVDAVNS